ncbi:unnamed protein product [Moneuplotes crassus]|uniref:Uncharacterized protein n=1 Tax=Euplotes crassus TaxID=5936 RepID=A0AAD1XZL2_EUPCR|nr:unnamed protein product [Moneuplotes crassus]
MELVDTPYLSGSVESLCINDVFLLKILSKFDHLAKMMKSLLKMVSKCLSKTSKFYQTAYQIIKCILKISKSSWIYLRRATKCKPIILHFVAENIFYPHCVEQFINLPCNYKLIQYRSKPELLGFCMTAFWYAIVELVTQDTSSAYKV